MPHVLIAGQTESGKTTLAKRLAIGYKAQGVHIIVCDPLLDRGWPADYLTDDVAAFDSAVKKARQCAVFIDESAEVVGRYNDHLFWLATRARHYGHNVHFLTQRPQGLARTVRDQCNYLFLFRVSATDAKLLADDWARPELENACALQKLCYIECARFGKLSEGKISFK